MRRFALKVPELVHATPLHGRPRPDLPDGPPQPGVALDDNQYRRLQPARDETVETALPRRERLARAEIEGEELLAAVGHNADHAQDGHARNLSTATHAQGKGIEVEVDDVDVGKRAFPPSLVLRRGDDARHRAL